MTVPLRFWHVLTLTLYTVVIAGVALVLALPLPLSLFLLCGIPLLLMLYESRLPLARLFVGVLSGALVLLVLEAVAHQTGAWYTLVSSTGRWYGLTVEIALFAMVHTLFYLVLYEFVFDDGKTESPSLRRYRGFMAFLATVVVASFYLFSVWLVSFAFLWVIVLLTAVVMGLLLLHFRGSLRGLVTKAGFFSLMVLPISLTHELIAVAAEVRVFAFTSEYIATVPLFGTTVPVEELLLLVLWPFMLVVIYECFVDDGK